MNVPPISPPQQWVLLVFGFLAGLIALAAAVALSVSVVEAIIYQGESLLKQCNFKDSDDADSSSSITYECPFDPTRLYSTTIILWVPLILMCVVEMVFSFRCSAVCCSFLYLCPCRRKPTQARRVRIHKAVEVPPRSPAEDGDSDTAAEPAEQEELLDSGAAAEQSDWL